MTSERIDEVFWSKHRLDDRAVAALSPEEVARIESIVRGRQENPNRVRAFDVLAAARGEAAVGALADAARDDSADPSVRAAAVGHLGRIGGQDAEGILLGLIGEARDPGLRIRVAQALAKAGTPDALPAFDELIAGSEPRVRQRAEFARSVLAYRHGVGGYELPLPSDDDLTPYPQLDGLPVRSSRASLQEVAAALSDLRRDGYGLELARDAVHGIDCGESRLVLAMDEVASKAFLSARDSRPRLLGLIAQQSPEDGSYATRWLVFTTPAKGETRLSVHRQTGEQVLFGSAVGSRSEARFHLSSVVAVGNPSATVEGDFQGGRLSLAGMSATTVGVAGGRGKRIPLVDEDSQ
jgi:hypothetical protein